MDEQQEALRSEPIDLGAIERGKKRAFLKAFMENGVIAHACLKAEIPRSQHYYWAEHDPAYACLFEQCKEHAADLLEAEAVRRAKDGVQKIVIYQGQLVMVPADLSKPDGPKVPLVEHQYSDILTMFILKGMRPEKFAERTKNENDTRLRARVEDGAPDLSKLSVAELDQYLALLEKAKAPAAPAAAPAHADDDKPNQLG